MKSYFQKHIFLPIVRNWIVIVVAVVTGLLIWFFINNNLQRSRAAQPLLNVTFNPQTQSFNAGDEQNIVITLQPAVTGTGISGLDVHLQATGSVEIVDVNATTINPNVDPISTTPDFINITKSHTVTTAEFVAVSREDDVDLPPAVYLNVAIKGTAGTGTLSVNTTQSQIVGNVTPTGTNFTYDFGTVQQGSYTFGQGTVSPPSGNTQLNLSLKFQGITQTPPVNQTMTAKVKLVSTATNTTFSQDVTFTSNASGIWSGTMNVNLNPSSDLSKQYSLFIKGPRHLKKRICVVNPTESVPGTYACSSDRISLNVGPNTLNFSGIYQLAGDLPVDNGAQNGIIDSVDTSKHPKEKSLHSIHESDHVTPSEETRDTDDKVALSSFENLFLRLSINVCGA